MIHNAALFYGSDTGYTESVAHDIKDSWKLGELKVYEANSISAEDFKPYSFIIIGLSTWYDGDLQSDWEDFFDEFKTIDFTGKTIALFGLGDQYGYAEYFIDGIGILAKVILQNGGKIIGYWPSDTYDFSESKALVNDNTFYGLAIDEENQTELTTSRIEEWINQLERELKEA